MAVDILYVPADICCESTLIPNEYTKTSIHLKSAADKLRKYQSQKIVVGFTINDRLIEEKAHVESWIKFYSHALRLADRYRGRVNFIKLENIYKGKFSVLKEWIVASSRPDVLKLVYAINERISGNLYPVFSMKEIRNVIALLDDSRDMSVLSAMKQTIHVTSDMKLFPNSSVDPEQFEIKKNSLLVNSDLLVQLHTAHEELEDLYLELQQLKKEAKETSVLLNKLPELILDNFKYND